MTLPLHERIRSDIEGGILSGALRPGDRLPVEHELMRTYSCARMTVNKALSALATAGLVERRKRAGTFVAQPRLHSMVLDVPDLAAEIAARGQAYRYQLLDREIRPAQQRNEEELALVSDEGLLVVQGVHFADDVPLAFEHRLINIGAVPAIVDADFIGIPPGTWLIRHTPWTEAENRIGAIEATAEYASHLQVPAGTACLLVERRTWRGVEGITYVKQAFVRGSYELVARFGPQKNKEE